MRRAALFACAVAVAACTSSTATEPPDTSSGTIEGTTPSTDPTASTTTPSAVDLDLDPVWRTTPELSSSAAFDQLAATGVGGQQVVKFSITDFFGEPNIEWLDSTFYELHDEWFWFRLLNGSSIPGLDVEPVSIEDAPQLDSIDAAYEWAEQRSDRLPLGLRFTALGRLYSSTFYNLALDDPDDRQLALGSVIRTSSEPPRWLLELEYRDAPTPAHIERYLDIISTTLPSSVAEQLLWVPRSREQELTAELMEADGLPYGDRTIRFDDLVEPGDVEVYASGVAAGRLLLVTDDGRYSLSDAGPNDIVVVQRTPDALPPGNGLITGTPQTPLAHVNVLALNRGIPNAFLGGLVDNVELSQLGRVRAPVAIQAIAQSDGPGLLDIRALTEAEFSEWNTRQQGGRISVPPLDWTSLPLTYDLDELSARAGPTGITERTLTQIRPSIGGKAAGFLGLIEPNRNSNVVTVPDRPLAITVKPYFEHIAPLAETIEAMLRSSTFNNSSRARFLVLEGSDDFAKAFDSNLDMAFVSDFERDETATVLGEIVAAGGLKQMIRDIPIAPETLASLDTILRDQFNAFDTAQGLRFRSSSSVEDIEGFNGAGLYSSNTGYLYPTTLPDPDDHKRTVERALTRTWSSYWNIEALEERRYENVNHISGGMAVLVHARFDDPLEISNGVATFTLLPDVSPDAAVMRLNVQAGDTSVTNPESGADGEPGPAPEIVELRQIRESESIRIDRVATSTLTNAEVLSDKALVDVWEQLSAVTVVWRDRINAELPESQQISTLTLDFEFREMDPAWPAGGIDKLTPRIVVKQARTLEPGLRALPSTVIELDVPRDVLARSTRVDRVSCPSSDGTPDADVRIEITTDALAVVDFGFADTPLTLSISGNPTRLEGPECERIALFASATDYLSELFATRSD